VGVDQPHAAGHHVGDVEDAAVGRELHVLRHRAGAQVDRPDDALAAQVDDDRAAGELARHERAPAVGRVVHVIDAGAARDLQHAPQPHRVRLAEVELAMALGDDDRAAPVSGEVQVVGIEHPHGPPVAPGARIDRGEAVALVVGHPQRAQVPRRRHVLGQRPDSEVLDDLRRALVDDVHGVRLRVGDVHARGVPADLRREAAGPIGRVNVDDVTGRRELRRRAVHRARVLRRWRRARAASRRDRRDEDQAARPPSAHVRARRRCRTARAATVTTAPAMTITST
jgi:hypothetical protein